MGMSDLYGAADRDESIATIHAALDAGHADRHRRLLRQRPQRAPDPRGAGWSPARQRGDQRESLGALEVQLGDADLAQIERAIPPGAAAGDRYDTHQMRILDSER